MNNQKTASDSVLQQQKKNMVQLLERIFLKNLEFSKFWDLNETIVVSTYYVHHIQEEICIRSITFFIFHQLELISSSKYDRFFMHTLYIIYAIRRKQSTNQVYRRKKHSQKRMHSWYTSRQKSENQLEKIERML